MVDGSKMFPDSYHPMEPDLKRDYSGRARYYTRTQRPPKYYIIDFGISRRYALGDETPLEPPIWGGDKSVPEFHKSTNPCDPFPTDMYYIGNLIRKDFLEVSIYVNLCFDSILLTLARPSFASPKLDSSS